MLFEKGESGHGGDRIVRVGTHTGRNQLRSRLQQHFLAENKDRSIFRKNIGRAILAKTNDPFLVSWERDLTTARARKAHGTEGYLARKHEVEQLVSRYIREHFSFAVVEITDAAERLELESKLISTVSLCEECGPSKTWLGKFSPKEKIRKSGLWLVNELYRTPLSALDLERLVARGSG